MGEVPDLPRSGVFAVLNAAEDVRVLAEKLRRVSDLHEKVDVAGLDYCDHDDVPWPCDTMRIVEARPL